MMETWCILRTSGPRTLPLARSLAAASFDVWTPTQPVRSRVPRRRAWVGVDAPLLPTFVFARSQHVSDLLLLQNLEVIPHPRFSVFRHCGRIPTIADADIIILKEEEASNARVLSAGERRIIPVGSRINIKEGPFAGMSGIVEAEDGQHVLVAFAGMLRVKIASFLLHDDELSDGEAEHRHRRTSG